MPHAFVRRERNAQFFKRKGIYYFVQATSVWNMDTARMRSLYLLYALDDILELPIFKNSVSFGKHCGFVALSEMLLPHSDL